LKNLCEGQGRKLPAALKGGVCTLTKGKRKKKKGGEAGYSFGKKAAEEGFRAIM